MRVRACVCVRVWRMIINKGEGIYKIDVGPEVSKFHAILTHSTPVFPALHIYIYISLNDKVVFLIF